MSGEYDPKIGALYLKPETQQEMADVMKIIKIFLLILLTFSCRSNESNLLQIDPREWIENTFTLSEIADDISYIPLDDSIPIIVSPSPRAQVSNKCIFIPVGMGTGSGIIGIVKFNRDGSIISKIGTWGRGPDEYMSFNFSFDERTGTIYILDNNNKIKVYSKYGKFIREISLKKYGDNFDNIDVFYSKLIISMFLRLGEAKYNWIILDTLGNLIKTKENSVPPFKDNPGLSGTTYRYNNRLFYTNYYNDTVFSILPDLTYKTAFLFSPGEHRWPRGKVTAEAITQYIFPLRLFETKRFIGFYYGHGWNRATAYIDKKSNETLLVYNENRNWISNDLDGGILFDPFNSSYFEENDQEFLVGLIDSYQLKVHTKSDEFKSFVPKYPEKKKELEKLANGLKETDNPVLVLVKLKK
jgi:hypothetical protein